jgi:hypothetical protein
MGAMQSASSFATALILVLIGYARMLRVKVGPVC